MASPIDGIMDLLATRGAAQYGGEAVSQLEHALQAAALAEAEGAAPALVAAALLHDLGHLLHKGERDDGRDDRHEHIGGGYLARVFGADVCEPIRLHVDAKRWLCAAEPGYFAALSPASVRSLGLQGGTYGPAAAQAFIARPYAADAVRLRRWDDRAKVPGAPTRALEDYRALLAAVARTCPGDMAP